VVMVTVGAGVGVLPPAFESPGASSPPQAATKTATATMPTLRNPARFHFMGSFSNRRPTDAMTGVHRPEAMLPSGHDLLRSLNSLMRSPYRTEASARSDTIFGVMKMINSVLSLIRASFLNSQPT